jgi:hypothetical protein
MDIAMYQENPIQCAGTARNVVAGTCAIYQSAEQGAPSGPLKRHNLLPEMGRQLK